MLNLEMQKSSFPTTEFIGRKEMNKTHFVVMYFTTKSPTSEVVYPILPAATFLTSRLTTFIKASSIALAAFFSPRCSSINWHAEIAAKGHATPLPLYLGAE